MLVFNLFLNDKMLPEFLVVSGNPFQLRMAEGRNELNYNLELRSIVCMLFRFISNIVSSFQLKVEQEMLGTLDIFLILFKRKRRLFLCSASVSHPVSGMRESTDINFVATFTILAASVCIFLSSLSSYLSQTTSAYSMTGLIEEK